MVSVCEHSVSNRAYGCTNMDRAKTLEYLEDSGFGVDDGVRTRDFRSHSPALCH